MAIPALPWGLVLGLHTRLALVGDSGCGAFFVRGVSSHSIRCINCAVAWIAPMIVRIMVPVGMVGTLTRWRSGGCCSPCCRR